MKNQLEDKIWFRALKILFLLSFLIAQAIGALTVNLYTALLPDKTIRCSDGRESAPLSYEEHLERPYLTPQQIQENIEAIKRQGGTAGDISGYLSQIQQRNLESVAQNTCGDLDFQLVSTSRYSIIEQVGFYFFSFVVITLLFLFTLRIFFYIAVGEAIIKKPWFFK